MHLILFILSILSFECLNTTNLFSASNSPLSSQDNAITVQHASATAIQAMLRSRKAHQEVEQFKKHQASAKIIQKSGRALLTRQDMRFYKILKNVAYHQFKDLVCSGDFLNKTDWFETLIQLQEKKQIFTRSGTDQEESNTTDSNNDTKLPSDVYAPNINRVIHLNTLFLRYIDKYIEAILAVFVERAVEEITIRNMPWSEAVSSKRDDKPAYPLGLHVCENPQCRKSSHFEIILGKVFSNVYAKLMPNFPLKFTVQYKEPLNLENENKTIIITALDQTDQLTILLKQDQDPKEVLTNYGYNNVLALFLQEYYPWIDLPDSLLINDSSKDDLPYKIENPNLSTSLYRDPATTSFCVNSFTKDLLNYKKLHKQCNHINWPLIADKIFELGRLLFENKLDAFDKLGGMAWLTKQPADLQQVIATHINGLQSKEAKT